MQCRLEQCKQFFRDNLTKMVAKSVPTRTVPLCHIKSVSKFDENDLSQTTYFNVVTEQQGVLTFRCKLDPGWVPQIQIQLIHFKLRLNQNFFDATTCAINDFLIILKLKFVAKNSALNSNIKKAFI